jgi:hypothetical protein
VSSEFYNPLKQVKLTFESGDTINFKISTIGHPVYLKTTSGTEIGDSIISATNNGAESGTVSLPPSATGTFYNQCSHQDGRVGKITIQ